MNFFLFTTACSGNKANSNVVKPANDAVTRSIVIEGSVGKLQAVLHIPKLKVNKKCPLAILMHGIMSSKDDGLMVELANELHENGIASVRFDFNGHGDSDGEFINMTVPYEVEDALAVFKFVEKLEFISNISLIGHSQGGVVASLAAGKLKDTVKSVVLMAPAAVLVQDSQKGSIMGNIFNPENVPDYVNVFDYKVGRHYILSAQQLNIYDQAEDYKGPVCLIHGKADRVVPYSCSKKYDAIYKNATLHLLDVENHMFSRDRLAAIKIAVDFLVRSS